MRQPLPAKEHIDDERVDGLKEGQGVGWGGVDTISGYDKMANKIMM